MANLKVTLAAVTAGKNLQSTAVNPIAAPVATPRPGGFTLRNRIKWGSVNSSAEKLFGTIASSAATGTRNFILQVPSRTLVRALTFQAVPGSSATTTAFSISSAHASGAKSGTFQIGAYMYKDASQAAASAKTSLTAFKTSIAITKKTGAIASTFGTVAASTPWTQAVPITAASLEAVPFPFGGFIQMNIVAGSSALKSIDKSSTSLSGMKYAGTLEVQALCGYLPE